MKSFIISATTLLQLSCMFASMNNAGQNPSMCNQPCMPVYFMCQTPLMYYVQNDPYEYFNPNPVTTNNNIATQEQYSSESNTQVEQEKQSENVNKYDEIQNQAGEVLEELGDIPPHTPSYEELQRTNNRLNSELSRLGSLYNELFEEFQRLREDLRYAHYWQNHYYNELLKAHYEVNICHYNINLYRNEIAQLAQDNKSLRQSKDYLKNKNSRIKKGIKPLRQQKSSKTKASSKNSKDTSQTTQS